MPITVPSNYSTLIGGTTYYIVENGFVQTDVTSTSAGNVLTCTSTSGFYDNMLITFTGTALGGTILDTAYYVIGASITGTQFKISLSPSGSEIDLTSDSGAIMTVTGQPYIKVSDTLGGSVYALTNASTNKIFTQEPTAVPEFDVSWILGGYRVTITDPGEGYTVTNTITIPGNLLGGTTPANNLVMTVNTIDTITANPDNEFLPLESDGTILSVICAGTPNDVVE